MRFLTAVAADPSGGRDDAVARHEERDRVAAQGVPGGGSYHPESSDFTIACRGSAIAKCVELGYKPWTGVTSQLASCVRLLRADFCGTGTSYTKDGQLVNLYDNLGIQKDTEAWSLEAGWNPQGATCIAAAADTASRL